MLFEISDRCRDSSRHEHRSPIPLPYGQNTLFPDGKSYGIEGSKEVLPVDNASKRILLVEDQRVAALSQRALLRSLGFSVEIVATGEDAVARTRQGDIDLVLMDIELGPGINGGEAARRIRKERDIPVVFLSAHIDAVTLGRTRDAGAYGYVVKGTGEALLQAVLSTAFELFETRRQLRESEARYRILIENSHDIIYALDSAGRFSYVSPSNQRLLGGTPEALRGTDPRTTLHPDDLPVWEHFIRRIQQGNSFLSGVEYRVRHADGSWRWHSTSATAVRNDQGELLSIVGICHDITDRKELEEALRHQATHDTLTGLPNRTLFLDRLEHEMAVARRRGRGGALLFLDLDNFKSINDTLGHNIGDRLLIAVADRLRALVREADTVARMGGDEFTVLLPEAGGRDSVADVATRICQALYKVFLVEGHELFVSASVGISTYPEDGNSVSTLMKLADMAMYRAKAAGRNTWRFWGNTLP